ncbi:M67 family metallopeptidase [Sphingomonas sp.]|uniref:M67 family metallopeptidase n=1 Tax=Sphingomonas sp. TaxID=28214 RepID=UPI002FC73A75
MLDRFAAEAAADPREICGLLLGRDDVIHDALALPNVAPEPARGFAISPADQFAAARFARAAGLAVVGCYHSHPSGNLSPSAADLAEAAQDGFYWLIIDGARRRLWISRAGGQIAGRFDPVELQIIEAPAFRESSPWNLQAHLQPAGASANRRRGTSQAPRQGPSPQ